MKISRIVLLLVALLAGGLAAFLATRGGAPQPVQAPSAPAVAVAKTQVLVAKVNIGLGQRLTADNLEWQQWPENAVRPEFITSSATPDAMKDMPGAVARFELFAGEPILQAKLVKADQGYLSAVLDKGKRGVSISVSSEAASGGFIVPNDHVDVILTRTTDNGQTSEPVLTNVRVLAINARLGETGTTGGADTGSGDPATADPKSQVFSGGATATLELSPDQADTVINAGQLGKLSLALRSIVDFADSTSPQDVVKRNAPIRIIRSGNETNVMAGVVAGTNADGVSVDPVNFAPAVTVTPTVSPLE
jgi:pilus assembly protein CpaB